MATCNSSSFRSLSAHPDCESSSPRPCCRSLGVWVRHFLVKRLGSLPGMTEALERGITVADVGCGYGPHHANILSCLSDEQIKGQSSSAMVQSAALAALARSGLASGNL